jgi:hypothetical protein
LARKQACSWALAHKPNLCAKAHIIRDENQGSDSETAACLKFASPQEDHESVARPKRQHAPINIGYSNNLLFKVYHPGPVM